MEKQNGDRKVMTETIAELPLGALSLRFFVAGSSSRQKDGAVHNYINPFAGMIQVLFGHCEVSLGQRTEIIHPGEVFFKQAGRRTRVVFFGDPAQGGFAGTRWLSLHFVLWGTVQVTGLLEIPLRLAAGPVAPFVAIMDELLQSPPAVHRHPLGCLARRHELAHRIVRLICDTFPMRDDTPERLQRIHRLEPVSQYLHDHLAEPIDVPTLARLVHLSPSRFHAVFQTHMHMTPMKYAKDLRLSEGCKRLLQGNGPIGVIAGEVGFSNPHHFSREFKVGIGMSPTEYRSSHRVPLG